jgi:hypothetical protein
VLSVRAWAHEVTSGSFSVFAGTASPRTGSGSPKVSAATRNGSGTNFVIAAPRALGWLVLCYAWVCGPQG